MKQILCIGHSKTKAQNMARDLIDDTNETVSVIMKETEFPFIDTEEGNRYIYLSHFHIKESIQAMRGMKFDEVYFMGDFSFGLVEELKSSLIVNTPNAKFFSIDPDITNFSFR
jgi:hypothetical protein